MRRALLAIPILLGLVAMLSGEEALDGHWKKAVVGGVNMTQTGFDNWIAGGESAYAWQVNLTFKFIQDRAKSTWSTSGKMSYGATKTGDADMRKSVDEIKLESVLTYKLGSSLNPFAALTTETQFSQGYDYTTDPALSISGYLDPGYFRESLGVGYAVRQGVDTRAGLALKQTIAQEYPETYTDDITTDELETFKIEAGAESVTDINFNISETSQYVSKLELFTAFKAIDETDINWDNTVSVKVTQFVNMSINVKVIYDKDLSAKRQIKQSMALGLNYTFI